MPLLLGLTDLAPKYNWNLPDFPGRRLCGGFPMLLQEPPPPPPAFCTTSKSWTQFITRQPPSTWGVRWRDRPHAGVWFQVVCWHHLHHLPDLLLEKFQAVLQHLVRSTVARWEQESNGPRPDIDVRHPSQLWWYLTYHLCCPQLSSPPLGCCPPELPLYAAADPAEIQWTPKVYPFLENLTFLKIV